MALNAVEMSLYLSQAAMGECVACAQIHELDEFGGYSAKWHDPGDVARGFEPSSVRARLSGDEPMEYAPRGWPKTIRPIGRYSKAEMARCRLFYRRYGRGR